MPLADTIDEVIETAVGQLSESKILAWMHGRMEFGARALGNRSLLASPLDPYSTENLNAFIKYREPFRKFAASVPAELCSEYFEVGSNARYLSTVGRVRPEHRERFTAAILAEAAGWSGPPRTDARWNEYDHLGVLARYGTPLPPDAGPRAVQPLLDRALRAWIDEDGTGEDGWKAFATGATTALDELVAGLGAGRDAVVVTSGGVLAAICGALLRTGADGVVALHRVAVNAAITTVVAGGSGTSLLAFNDHAHFTGDRRQLLTYR